MISQKAEKENVPNKLGMLIVTFFGCFSTVFQFVFLLFLLPTQKFSQ